VHASSGIDEIAGDAPTHVYQFSPRGIVRWEIEPADYGIAAPLAAIVGGEPAVNAQALRAILEGERSPRADVVALNAALALVVVERAGDLREGLAAARASLQSGAALAVFESLRGPTEMQFA
jgi:anthranilate phosphoribosyltransferase